MRNRNRAIPSNIITSINITLVYPLFNIFYTLGSSWIQLKNNMTAIDVIDSIEINATPETVFNVIADYSNMQKWFPVYNCKVQNANKIAEGVTVEHTYGKPPFVLSHFIRRVDKIIPGSRLEESYINGDLRGTGVWTFEKKGNATIAAYHCKVDGMTWPTRFLFKLVGNGAHSNTYQKLLKALKQHCENL